MHTGSGSGPLHGAMAHSEVLRAGAGYGRIPDNVLAAAHQERALRRLQRRIRWWSRLHLIR
ncbi:MAG TPA: hypothetical protein VGN59_05070 [Acidimicrobiia bacterium]